MPRFNDDSPYLDRDKPFVQFTQGQFTLAVCLILIGLTASFLLGITVTRFESKAGTAGKTTEASPSVPTPTKTASTATPASPEKPAVPKTAAGSTSPAPTATPTTTAPKGTASQQNTTTVEIRPKSIDVPAPPPEGKEVKPASVIPPAQPRKVDTETVETPPNKAASPAAPPTPAASPATSVAAPTTPKPPTAPTPPVKPDAKQQQPAGSGAKTAKTTSKSDSPDSSHNASWTRGYAIQLVAFSSKEPQKAEEYKRRLEKNSDIRVELLNTKKHVRVMLGPFKNKTTVQSELAKIKERKGFADAFVQPLPLAD